MEKSGKRGTFLLAGLVALVGLVICGIAFGWTVPGEYVIPVILLALLAAGSVIYGRIRFRELTREVASAHTTPFETREVSSELDTLIDATGPKRLTPAAVYPFVTATVDPNALFIRISEQVSQYHRSRKTVATYSMVLADGLNSPDADFVIPLRFQPKGSLSEGLKLFSPDAKRVSSLDSRRHVVYSLAVIRNLIWSFDPLPFAYYIDPANGIEERVQDLIASRSVALPHNLENVITQLLSLPGLTLTKIDADTIRLLVTRLANFNAISVMVPSDTERRWPNVVRYSMEFRTIPEIDDAPGAVHTSWVIRALDALRLALGVRLNRLYVPTDESLRTPSYHLEVEGPLGTYLAASELILAKANDPVVSKFEVTIQPRQGQRRAHLYIGKSAPMSGFFATKFFERAPGSFAPATFVSLAAAVVIWLLVHQQLTGGGNVQTWLLPALLAVPVAATALSGLEAGKEHRHPSLLSRLLALATIAISLGAFALASWFPKPTTGTAHVDGLWIATGMLATVVFLTAAYTWILRLVVENHFIRRIY